MSAHNDEAERAAADGGPRPYTYELDFLVYRERAAQGRQSIVYDLNRGRDELGHETDDMLRERITRSAAELGAEYKGQRLPYVPRQGPVFKTDQERRIENFEHALEALQAEHGVRLEGDYWPACVDE